MVMGILWSPKYLTLERDNLLKNALQSTVSRQKYNRHAQQYMYEFAQSYSLKKSATEDIICSLSWGIQAEIPKNILIILVLVIVNPYYVTVNYLGIGEIKDLAISSNHGE